MWKWFTSLLELLGFTVKYAADKQSIDAGRAVQKQATQEQVEQNVQAAKDAVATPDVVRTERLRDRFDRSRQHDK